MIIRLLCAVLFIWQPLSFAGEAAVTLPSIGMRGVPAILELAAHGALAVLTVAASMALRSATPHGVPLAAIALVGSALGDVQRLYWSVLPSQTKPGDELPLALLSVAHSAAWLTYLRRTSRRSPAQHL